ncbi:MAG: toll/interleukin-1 receptor domain-containing protein [Pseudomonadota bacterium]
MPKSYRAFISYSHVDDAAAKRLHKRIETYRPPRRLGDGKLKRISPVFRDREELATNADLPGRLHDALMKSENLVVLCSPSSAASKYVNMEIELFAAAKGVDAIHPVIVSGPSEDAFPPALKAAIEAPLAADLRDGKDGREDGALKLIAGILGVPFSAVKDREAARARARVRLIGAVAAIFAVLTVAAAALGLWALDERDRANQQLARAERAILTAVGGVETMVEQVAGGAETGDVTTKMSARFLSTAEGMVSEVVDLAGNNPKLRREYADLEFQLSRHYVRSGDVAAALAAAELAEEMYAGLLADGGDPDARKWRANAIAQQGDALRLIGDAAAALAKFRDARDAYRDLVLAEPESLRFQLNEAAMQERIGKALTIEGDLAGGRAALVRGQELVETVLRADPALLDARRQSYILAARMADLDFEKGAVEDALLGYGLAMNLSREMAEAAPGNMQYTRDLSTYLIDLGDVWARRRDADEENRFAKARSLFLESLAISQRLLKADPANVVRQREMTIPLERLGQLEEAGGRFGAALDHYEEALGMARALQERDPLNSLSSHELALSLLQTAEMEMKLGERAAAARAYAEAASLYAALRDRFPGDARWPSGEAAAHWGEARAAPAERAHHLDHARALLLGLEARGALSAADTRLLLKVKALTGG